MRQRKTPAPVKDARSLYGSRLLSENKGESKKLGYIDLQALAYFVDDA